MDPQWIAIIISWAMAGIALFQIWDLKKSRKREDSPFFVFYALRINQPSHTTKDGRVINMLAQPKTNQNVPEDYPAGDTVMISFQNKGSEARAITFDDLTNIDFYVENNQVIQQEDTLDIRYRYDPDRRGKIELFKICYETVRGERGEQVLEHPHGLAKMKRKSIK